MSIIAFPYLPRADEWSRLLSTLPDPTVTHNLIIVVNDRGVASAPDHSTARSLLAEYPPKTACVVERLTISIIPYLSIWD